MENEALPQVNKKFAFPTKPLAYLSPPQQISQKRSKKSNSVTTNPKLASKITTPRDSAVSAEYLKPV